MGRETAISWADHSASPWVGCSVAHTGCNSCYARDFSQKKHGKVRGPWALWGPGQDRLVTKGFWTDAPKWARAAARDGVRRTIFPSLMDPLDAEVYQRSAAPDGVACRATFDRFMHLIAYTSPGELVGGGLVWLLLTKRPENWRWIPEDVRPYCWLLYSASDQPTLEDGMAHLRHADGFAGLGLSLEPLVGPIAFESAWLKVLSWILIGGESGRHARPCDVAWIRAIVRQCREAGVAPYVKQLGAVSLVPELMGTGPEIIRQDREELARWPEGTRIGNVTGDPVWNGRQVLLRHPAGADPSEWPEDLRVQEFPEGLR